MEQWILLAHVLAGATWFGGHVYTEALTASASRTGDPETIMTVGLRSALTNGRLFIIAGSITLLSGFWLVFESVYEFETLFVAIGLPVTLAALVMGFFVLRPREVGLKAAVEKQGLIDPETMAAAKRVGMLRHVMTLIVTIVIILMVLKPGV
ncbi:MAG: DUF2269 family protein [Actinomycetota bacterium]